MIGASVGWAEKARVNAARVTRKQVRRRIILMTASPSATWPNLRAFRVPELALEQLRRRDRDGFGAGTRQRLLIASAKTSHALSIAAPSCAVLRKPAS